MLNEMSNAQLGKHSSSSPALQWDGAPSESQSSGPAFLARTCLVDKAFRRLRPRRLLDIGCGRGYVTAIAGRHASAVVAVDQAPEAVAETRTRLLGHPDAEVWGEDALRGPWHEEQRRGFDAVLLSEVLEHLDDDLGALAAIRELLMTGGNLVVTVPAKPSLWTRWDDLAGHRRRYRKAELADRLTTAGFTIREIRSWGFPVTGWLAIRGAKMRSRRVCEGSATEIPGSIQRLLPLAKLGFTGLSRLELMFSRLDRGAGYVAIATRDD